MRRLPLLFAVLVAAAAGCGGDAAPEGPDRPAVTVPAGGSVRIAATEYRFDPSNVVVSGGRKVRLTLDNRGDLAHDLRLRRDGREVGGVDPFPGGGSRSASVAVGPGRYEMFCSVGNHEELGMKGRLEVK